MPILRHKPILSPKLGKTQLSRRYVSALLLIAIMATASFSILYISIEREAAAAKVINIAGRQRMLSQRIAVFLNLANNNPEKPAFTENARQAIDLFEQSHLNLVKGNPTLGLPGLKDDRTRSIYFGDAALDEKSRAYIRQAREALTELAQTRSIPPLVLLNINRFATDDLLATLDLAVNGFERSSSEAIENLKAIQVIVYSLTLVLLLFEALFIFRPAVRQITHALKRSSNAEVQSRRAAHERQLILDAVSHELRTPLNNILFSLAAIKQDALTDDDRRHLESINKGCGEIVDSIAAVMNFVSVEAATHEIRLENTDVLDLIKRILRQERPTAFAKGLKLYVQENDDMPAQLMLDKDVLATVLRKLVHNAIKFTEEGRVIVDLSWQKRAGDDGTLKIDIRDTGRGIARDKIETLFTPFESAARDGSITRGLGLGLSYAKTAIEHIGGSLKVVSQENVGSTFSLSLPATAVEITGEQQPETTATPSSGLHCLVAEDNPVNQIILKKLLKDDGHTVTMVNNGLEAVQEAVRNQHDAILLDIVMPELKGDEACRKIKARLDGHCPKIIAVTANAAAEDIANYYACGFDSVVAKPIDPDALKKALA